MTTITVDILDEKAIDLLKDLESLNIIRLRGVEENKGLTTDLAVKYSGAMTRQSPEEIDKQLADLRKWD